MRSRVVPPRHAHGAKRPPSTAPAGGGAVVGAHRVLARYGFVRAAKAMYVRPIDPDQAYWVCAYPERGALQVAFGFRWLNVNRAARRALSAVDPAADHMRSAPEAAPPRCMCGGPGPHGVYRHPEAFGRALASFIAEERGDGSLAEALDQALRTRSRLGSNRVLVPAALAVLGWRDDFAATTAAYNAELDDTLAAYYAASYAELAREHLG